MNVQTKGDEKMRSSDSYKRWAEHLRENEVLTDILRRKWKWKGEDQMVYGSVRSNGAPTRVPRRSVHKDCDHLLSLLPFTFLPVGDIQVHLHLAW